MKVSTFMCVHLLDETRSVLTCPVMKRKLYFHFAYDSQGMYRQKCMPVDVGLLGSGDYREMITTDELTP